MKKNWRPEGFKDVIKNECHCRNCKRLINLGADAILESIWKLAKESPTGTFTFDSRVINIYGVDNGEET